jgi:hypothetical protein
MAAGPRHDGAGSRADEIGAAGTICAVFRHTPNISFETSNERDQESRGINIARELLLQNRHSTH